MSLSKIASALGRCGGIRRAQRLSSRRRAEIARMGARARKDSLRLAAAIRSNFDYIRAIDHFAPRPHARSETGCNRRLPGIYDAST